MSKLEEILFHEINWNTVKKIYKPVKYILIKSGRWLKKQKIGPVKCFVYSFVLNGLASYFGYYKAGEEVAKGDYTKAAVYYAVGLPMDYAAKILFFAGGYILARKGYKKLKETIREKRDNIKNHYNNYKNNNKNL